MKTPNTSRFSPLLLIPSFLLGLNSYAISERDLLTQSARPSVAQTQQLLATGWRPEALHNATQLAKTPGKGVIELQNDFPTWYQQVIQGAPRMLACFEKTFPGAKWAFIGRDTAPIADFFDAFYQSLGQTDRVARIPMSSETLESLNTDGATLSLLAKSGLDVTQLSSMKHPYILVDAISKKGGTQGRHLLDAIFKPYRGKHAMLSRYINFIGLRVSTTELPYQDVCNGYQILNSNEYSQAAALGSFHPGLILSYDDLRPAHTFVGINEAGYTHWVGAWHGPYGESRAVGNQWTLPEPGEPTDSILRKYVLDYQAHLILAAQSPHLLQKVQQAAHALSYTFPIQRPTYISAPSYHFRTILTQVQYLRQIATAISDYHQYNFGRADLSTNTQAIIEAIGRVEKFNPAVNLMDERLAYLEILGSISANKQDEFVTATMVNFFSLGPSVELVNKLLAQLPMGSPLHRMVSAEALNLINQKPHEEAVKDYAALNRPKGSVIGSDSYTVAEAQFKKNHKKKLPSLKQFFSKARK